MMAIEEFEQLKKRYDHLLLEKTDLEDSLQNLRDAIEHINKTSEERFKKAFEAIADRFERLFPSSSGGMAKLSLVYPEGSTDSPGSRSGHPGSAPRQKSRQHHSPLRR